MIRFLAAKQISTGPYCILCLKNYWMRSISTIFYVLTLPNLVLCFSNLKITRQYLIE
uniref:Uncharacterized protein n=1 Tax=Lepeophtheirus salmonis TaxID=72036 RepID=A0A0K2UJ74_LEPSM